MNSNGLMVFGLLILIAVCIWGCHFHGDFMASWLNEQYICILKYIFIMNDFSFALSFIKSKDKY